MMVESSIAARRDDCAGRLCRRAGKCDGRYTNLRASGNWYSRQHLGRRPAYGEEIPG